jgi:hypothetical protein
MKIHNNTGKEIIYPNILIESLGVKQRLIQSLKSFGILFGLALGSLFIPVLHFFLVPLFLIFSLFFAWLNFKKIYKISSVKLSCPVCHGEIVFEASSSRLPIRNSCILCGAQLYAE